MTGKIQKSKKRFVELSHLAEQRGGRLLSRKYVSAKTKLKWCCSKGHEWLATPNGIKNGTWCPKCAAKKRVHDRKDSIEDMRVLAHERGGTCISKTYVNSTTPIEWKCAKGHLWKARPSNVKTGTWCPTCSISERSEKLRDTIENMNKLAASRGGICLSKKYVGARSRLKWCCSSGHVWFASPNSIRQGSWCRRCAFKRMADHRSDTIEEMQSIAESHGGKCLSTEYQNQKTRLNLICAEGHTWEAQAVRLKSGGWCPYCAKKRIWGDPIIALQEIAEKRGGSLVSKRYTDNITPLKWRCADGHLWKARPANIKSGKWCPYCYGNVTKTIEEVRKEAREKGGTLLSMASEYKNTKSILRWRCSHGHEWEASRESAINYHWCPQCNSSSSLGERLYRDILEQVFQEKFPRKRPSWLVTNDGKRLELDGYCEKIQIAFEYHGPQHHEQTRFFHRREKDFEDRKYYDEQKRSICRAHGVRLIEISYTTSAPKLDELKKEISRQFKTLKIEPPKNFEKMRLSLTGPYQPNALNEVKVLCEANGGSLLSTAYLGSTSPLKVRCKSGHTWDSSASKIKAGNWCPFCAGRRVWRPLDELKKIAKSRHGVLLSESYLGSATKLKWRCKVGHEWLLSPEKAKAGSWCPYCAKVKIYGNPLDILREVAKDKGGGLLSKNYKTAKTKLKWKCEHGHVWVATPDKIKRGSWCPVCYRNLRGAKKEGKPRIKRS